jgi:hypothetical protein
VVALHATTNEERYRAIRGLAKGAVTHQATTFQIDEVEPLAGGLDPVSGIAAAAVTITKTQKEALPDDTEATAIYNGTSWELLVSERYRMIRGKTTAAVSSPDETFTIDGVVTLNSGLDPRDDPTSPAEFVTVQNTHTKTHDDNETVVAVFRSSTNQWEEFPTEKGEPGESGTYAVQLLGDIEAGNVPTALGEGDGSVYSIGDDGALTFLGSRKIYNPFPETLPESDAVYPCHRTGTGGPNPEDAEFTIASPSPLAWIKHQPGFAGGGQQVFSNNAGALEWFDLVCTELTIAAECVGGQWVVTTEHYWTLGACEPAE